MVDMIVDIEALNFRSSAGASGDNRIGTVFLGQRLRDVESSGTDGWVRCTADIDGAQRPGFVSERFLRAPLSATREALIASVHREWVRFKRGTGLEHIAPFSGFVGEMWAAIGERHLDGTDRDVPWSAAAISFMVRNAGSAYGAFKFAAAHSKYCHHAISARLAGDRSVPFWGFRLHETQPRIGDIVCRDNPNHAPAVDFDVASSIDSFRSHCDIIMRIDSPRQKVIAIGGNVSHSVNIAEYDLAPGDLLAGTKNVYALLRNITDE